MAITRVAIDARRSILGTLAMTFGALLLMAGLSVLLQCRPGSTRCGAVSIIELPPAVTRALPPIQLGALIVPPDHPDARPWPLGMVIAPPATADAINVAPQVDLADVLAHALAMLLTPGSSATES